MQFEPNEIKVVSLCSYLTGDLKPREIDWPAIKMVKALKGDPIKGYFDIEVDGRARRFNQGNVAEFLAHVPRVMGAAILERLTGKATIVPIPNSHVVRADDPDFPTLKLAREIAACSNGRLSAAPALVFSEPQIKARKGGPRNASHCFAAYRVVQDIRGPIVLVDDVWTLGGHLKAACWKLQSEHRSLVLACTLGRTTHEHVEKPVCIQEYTLDIRR